MRQGPAPLPQFWSGLRFDHRLAFPLRPSRRGFLPALLRLRTSGSLTQQPVCQRPPQAALGTRSDHHADMAARHVEAVRLRQLRKDRFRPLLRSEEHTSELQSLMRTSYAVFCLIKTPELTF